MARNFQSFLINTLFTVALVTPPVHAELRTDIPGKGFPQYQCSYCEVSDKPSSIACTPRTVDNYCACRKDTQPDLRILLTLKGASTPIDWTSFEKKQIANLKKKLIKKGALPEEIALKTAQLRKKLRTKHTTLKAQCTPPVGNDSDGMYSQLPGDGRGNRIFILNSSKQSYATDISDNGSILGGSYPLSVPTPASASEPIYYTGLTRTQQGNTKIQPWVIKKGGMVVACDDCAPGMALLGLNQKGLAVGEKLGTTSEAPAQGIVFDYNKQSLSLLPLLGTASSSLFAINDSGISVGLAMGANGSGLNDSFTYASGSMTKLDRQKLLAEHLRVYAGIVLNAIKKTLKEDQEFNECGDGEIESTQLTGNGSFFLAPSIIVSDINRNGDIVGSISASGGITWSYTGACRSDKFHYLFDHSVFVISSTGAITIYPTASTTERNESNEALFAPTGINGSGSIVGAALDRLNTNLSVGLIDSSRGTAPFRLIRFAGLENYAVMPAAINDAGVIVGSYFPVSSPREMRGFVLSNGIFTDLNSYLAKGAGWTIHSANALNSCGQIAANAFDSTMKRHTMVVISPDKCGSPVS